jgi:hypothetical protein
LHAIINSIKNRVSMFLRVINFAMLLDLMLQIK